MFYAERDREGRIVAIRKEPGTEGEGAEIVSEQELLDFLTEGQAGETYESLLRLTDSSVIRVLEDLIEVLISKNLILLTDLPEEARVKIGARRETRKRMHEEHTNFTVDDIL